MFSLDYLAGFIDGEGSLSLARIPRRGRSTEYCVRLSIANTNKRILLEVQSEFGGTLARNPWKNPRWKPSYALIWTNAAAVELLRMISSRLRVKSSNAVLLLEFAEHVTEYGRPRDRKGRLLSLSKGEKEIREVYHERLRLLNARGPREPHDSGRGDSQDSSREERGGVSLEYLAGFIDGEGSLMIAKTYVRRYGTTQYRSRLAISNCDRRILEAIKRDYGGIIVAQGHSVAGWKNGYQLVWTSGMIRRFLPLIRSHLRIKRDQADLLLDFSRHVKETPMMRDCQGFVPHPREVIDFREGLYQHMRKLNAKGPRPSSS
ncbi:MAG: hypothetical protein ACE5EW_04390 [Thermoplasmata archaeon]